MHKEELGIILISYSFSERMGGEATRAFNYFKHLTKAGYRVTQITHAQSRCEHKEFASGSVCYVGNTLITNSMYHSDTLRHVLYVDFNIKAAFLAKKIKKILEQEGRKVLVHFHSIVSPVTPYLLVPNVQNVIGPLNGNIYFPESLRKYESRSERFRGRFHKSAKKGLKYLWFNQKTRADVILVAGGDRTKESLLLEGCRETQFVEAHDNFVSDELFNIPRIKHTSKNLHFVYFGRLVFYKGISFLIESLTRTRKDVRVDIIGDGPEKDRLVRHARNFGVEDRVRFVDWIDHSKLHQNLANYRALVSPSLADPGATTVQEAMALGLPVVCLNWGGPALYVDEGTGILIDPIDEVHVVEQLASSMDALCANYSLAEKMSIEARKKAERYRWSLAVREWIDIYHRLVNQHQ